MTELSSINPSSATYLHSTLVPVPPTTESCSIHSESRRLTLQKRICYFDNYWDGFMGWY